MECGANWQNRSALSKASKAKEAQAEKEAEREAKEQAKREAEEVKKVKEAEAQAEKEAEREAKEQAKREAEEVKKVKEAETQAEKEAEREAKEQATVLEIYEKNVRLVIPPSPGFEQAAQFQEYLEKVEDLAIVMTGGSVNGGTIIVVSAQKPLNLISILNEMPVVENVYVKGETITVTLKASGSEGSELI